MLLSFIQADSAVYLSQDSSDTAGSMSELVEGIGKARRSALYS